MVTDIHLQKLEPEFTKPTIIDKDLVRTDKKALLDLSFQASICLLILKDLNLILSLILITIPEQNAQLKETLLGKVLLDLGLFGDGTSFGEQSIKTITTLLQKLGMERNGNDILYNGMTGEQLETSIFIGPAFYQRLKHMVNDKAHSRSFGPMVVLTRQPAEGRSKRWRTSFW